nr:DUF2939 domain-containing protein [Acinetobacter baumannii]UMW89928.1 Unknown (DUF2939-domain) [Acinetobacter baumannii]
MASPFLHPGGNMNKKLIGALITVIVVLVGGYYYASPYIVLNSIKSAAQAGDSEKVSAYIDYSSVRQSFKDQMNAYMVKDLASKDTDGWEALGTMIATTMIDKMVDAVVTPEGMTLMLQGKDFKESLKPHTEQSSDQTTSKEKLDYSTRYLSMNLFEVTLKNPNNDKQLKVIMERDGLSWKVKKFVIPMDDMETNQTTEQQPTLPVEEILAETEAPTIIEQPETVFDYSGVQKGAQLESCYHDPCSIAKVMGFKLINQTPTESDLELTVVGGSRGFESESIEWNHEAHKIQIHCSITKPTLQIGDQVTVIPLNDSGVPGVLWSDAETYMQACHNYTGEMGAGIQQYGYNVQSYE